MGQRTPNPSTQSQQKTHTTIFFSLSPIQRTFERPLQQTLTHPISNPPTLTPTLQHKWSTRGGGGQKNTFFSLFFAYFSRYNNLSYFRDFFYIQNISINQYLCVFFILDKDQLPIKVFTGFDCLCVYHCFSMERLQSFYCITAFNVFISFLFLCCYTNNLYINVAYFITTNV